MNIYNTKLLSGKKNEQRAVEKWDALIVPAKFGNQIKTKTLHRLTSRPNLFSMRYNIECEQQKNDYESIKLHFVHTLCKVRSQKFSHLNRFLDNFVLDGKKKHMEANKK